MRGREKSFGKITNQIIFNGKIEERKPLKNVHR
jgi:hypothetical protein